MHAELKYPAYAKAWLGILLRTYAVRLVTEVGTASKSDILGLLPFLDFLGKEQPSKPSAMNFYEILIPTIILSKYKITQYKHVSDKRS